jgi:hypothetical protein
VRRSRGIAGLVIGTLAVAAPVAIARTTVVTDPRDVEGDGTPITAGCDIVRATAKLSRGRMVHTVQTQGAYRSRQGALMLDTGGASGPDVSIVRSKITAMNNSARVRSGARARFSVRGRTATISFRPGDVTRRASYRWAAVMYCDGFAPDQAPGARVLGSSKPSKYQLQSTRR